MRRYIHRFHGPSGTWGVKDEETHRFVRFGLQTAGAADRAATKLNLKDRGCQLYAALERLEALVTQHFCAGQSDWEYDAALKDARALLVKMKG